MSVAHTCIYDTDSCKYAKYEFGEPVTSKCKDCGRNPNIKKTKMEENSNNLKYENDKPTDSPSSVKISDTNLIWTAYYSPDEELRNNLKSVVASDMDIDEKINLILALCRQQMMVQIPNESSNPCATVNCEYLNSFLEKGWKVVMVTPKSNYNEYIIEKEITSKEKKTNGTNRD